uniref:Uncharacterized protein n=1 Tax=Leersia perrieri TaxID=77586 RepID=A0A0D9VKZ7_9ORYZ
MAALVVAFRALFFHLRLGKSEFLDGESQSQTSLHHSHGRRRQSFEAAAGGARGTDHAPLPRIPLFPPVRDGHRLRPKLRSLPHCRHPPPRRGPRGRPRRLRRPGAETQRSIRLPDGVVHLHLGAPQLALLPPLPLHRRAHGEGDARANQASTRAGGRSQGGVRHAVQDPEALRHRVRRGTAAAPRAARGRAQLPHRGGVNAQVAPLPRHATPRGPPRERLSHPRRPARPTASVHRPGAVPLRDLLRQRARRVRRGGVRGARGRRAVATRVPRGHRAHVPPGLPRLVRAPPAATRHARAAPRRLRLPVPERLRLPGDQTDRGRKPGRAAARLPPVLPRRHVPGAAAGGASRGRRGGAEGPCRAVARRPRWQGERRAGDLLRRIPAIRQAPQLLGARGERAVQPARVRLVIRRQHVRSPGVAPGPVHRAIPPAHGDEREWHAVGSIVRSARGAHDVLREHEAARQVVARDGARVQPAHQTGGHQRRRGDTLQREHEAVARRRLQPVQASLDQVRRHRDGVPHAVQLRTLILRNDLDGNNEETVC